MTNQAHHGKVGQEMFWKFYNLIYFIQSVADGEFSQVKDKYNIHLTRREQGEDYLEVKDSVNFSKFGNENMHTPGPRAKIERRQFFHLDDKCILDRAAEV